MGYEDSVVNHILLIKDINSNDYDDVGLEKRLTGSSLSRRFFSV